ncbi:YeiH family protein [Bacillus thermotolerans]|uniref:YeiH family protein n=1 Tax=Bacillus thermotolerans TaxID=1221996 RepID=UPI00059242B4|nr:YeiH family protein [Bacillus thermotolerans]KKB44568.1 putative membrane protein YeiH [Bacillus thermotolerans]
MEAPSMRVQSERRQVPKREGKERGIAKGIAFTLMIAAVAGLIARLPFFEIMGIMILSILIGMVWKNTAGVKLDYQPGIQFSNKVLLRAGIILLGFRLNLLDIAAAGYAVLLTDALVIAFTMSFILLLGKVFRLNKYLTVLIAAGTAICGAAAILAVAPIMRGKQEYTAIAVSCIAILGTVGALMYIFLFPHLPITKHEYGILTGATLHELAHVVAAAVPGGAESSESAVLVKLGRVLLLIPVALLISMLVNRKELAEKGLKSLPIPWFIFGFLLASFVNTLAPIPEQVIAVLLLLSTYLLAMGMAGLGLNVNYRDFSKEGIKPVAVAVIGFAGLLALSPLILLIFRLL